jgi:hypothetical protein
MAEEADPLTQSGPCTLRWRAGRPSPEEERFENLDAALDAVEARWDTLQHQAPQVLDQRKVLLLSTSELQEMMAAEDPPSE